MSVVIMSGRAMRAHVVELVRRTVIELGLSRNVGYEAVVKALELPPVQFHRMPATTLGRRHDRQITINSDITCDARREFTIFHEILHILLDMDGTIPSELMEYVDGDSDDYHCRIEEFCNVGAAEWIMPSHEFKQLMDAQGWKLQALRQIKDGFRSSTMAAAFQFAHCNPDPCHVVICESRYSDQQASPQLDIAAPQSSSHRLTVAYTARNETNYIMRRNMVVAHDHLVNRAWRAKESMHDKAYGFFINARWPMECEVVPIDGRAYAVFYEKQRRWVTSEGQGSLDFGE